MSAISGLPANLSSAGGSGLKGQTLGQADFLRLMTAQMTMQDPFNPTDNKDMIAQMAQFSQVAGIAEINKSLASMAAGGAAARGIDSGWIGRSMLVDTDTATPLADGSYAGEISLPAAAGQVKVSLVDASGTVVHTQELGAQAAGPVSFNWNGKDEQGAVRGNGSLRVVVTAGSGDTAIKPTVSAWTHIRGIQSPAGGAAARLVTPLGLLNPDQAIRLG